MIELPCGGFAGDSDLAWPAGPSYGGDRTLCPVFGPMKQARRVHSSAEGGQTRQVSYPAGGSSSCRSRSHVASLSERCNSRSWLPGSSSSCWCSPGRHTRPRTPRRPQARPAPRRSRQSQRLVQWSARPSTPRHKPSLGTLAQRPRTRAPQSRVRLPATPPRGRPPQRRPTQSRVRAPVTRAPRSCRPPGRQGSRRRARREPSVRPPLARRRPSRRRARRHSSRRLAPRQVTQRLRRPRGSHWHRSPPTLPKALCRSPTPGRRARSFPPPRSRRPHRRPNRPPSGGERP
jgi:hypothetical protein